MSNREIASGTDFMVFVETGEVGAEVYRPFAGQTNCTLTRAANYRKSQAKNYGGTSNSFLGIREWSGSVDIDIPDEADVNADEVSFEELQDMEEAGTKPTLVFANVTFDDNGDASIDTTKRMYRGIGLINIPLNAPTGENRTTTAAIEGCLTLAIIDPA